MILNHNIPDFYFASFVETSQSADSSLSEGPGSVWINSRRLSPTWRRISIAALLQGLRSGDRSTQSHELAEEKLSKIATSYPAIIRKIGEASALNSEELADLSFLVLTLLTDAESPRFRSPQQKLDADEFTWEKFELAVSGAEAQTSRTRTSLEIPAGDLLDNGMHFILNRTRDPFVSSDRAIFVDSWEPKEAVRTFGTLNILDASVSGSTERVIALPLSPEVALISSSYISRGYPGVPYIECSSDETIVDLNLLTCYGAEKIIISSKDKPFGASESRVRKMMFKNLTS